MSAAFHRHPGKHCRLCLGQINENEIVDFIANRDLVVLTKKYFHVEIRADDGLTKKVCLKCAKKVIDHSRYHQAVQNNQQHLVMYKRFLGQQRRPQTNIEIHDLSTIINYNTIDESTLADALEEHHDNGTNPSSTQEEVVLNAIAPNGNEGLETNPELNEPIVTINDESTFQLPTTSGAVRVICHLQGSLPSRPTGEANAPLVQPAAHGHGSMCDCPDRTAADDNTVSSTASAAPNEQPIERPNNQPQNSDRNKPKKQPGKRVPSAQQRIRTSDRLAAIQK